MEQPARRPDSEFVGDIIRELKPEPDTAKAANEAIMETINMLRDAEPKFFSTTARNRTKQDAIEIQKAVISLEEEIAKASPEMRARLDIRGLVAAPQSRSDHPAVLTEALLATLIECDAAQGKKAEHLKSEDDRAAKGKQRAREINRSMAWCARAAWGLVLRFSPTNPENSSSNSPFRIVTGVLYEAVTGIQGKDLRRTCERIHRARLHLLPPKDPSKRG